MLNKHFQTFSLLLALLVPFQFTWLESFHVLIFRSVTARYFLLSSSYLRLGSSDHAVPSLLLREVCCEIPGRQLSWPPASYLPWAPHLLAHKPGRVTSLGGDGWSEGECDSHCCFPLICPLSGRSGGVGQRKQPSWVALPWVPRQIYCAHLGWVPSRRLVGRPGDSETHQLLPTCAQSTPHGLSLTLEGSLLMSRCFLLNYRVGGTRGGTVPLHLGSRELMHFLCSKTLAKTVQSLFACPLGMDGVVCLCAVVANILEGFFDSLDKMPLFSSWIKALFFILAFTFYSGEWIFQSWVKHFIYLRNAGSFCCNLGMEWLFWGVLNSFPGKTTQGLCISSSYESHELLFLISHLREIERAVG